MSKQYGLILPGNSKKPPEANFSRPSIFGDESDSDDGKPPIIQGPAAPQRLQAKKLQQKALEEDPTVFQYDELYDEMDEKRKQLKLSKENEVKNPRYIKNLLESADKRKKENERRIERQVQKERDAEGEMYKDKEAFVTSAYRKKLEEMRKAEELEKREEYLESIGDVTKQQNLDGFYRHLYEQKLGKDNKEKNSKDEEIKKEPNKPKERSYRKRKSSIDEREEEEKREIEKKAHIQSNIDADSDFSIDSSSDSEDEEKINKNKNDKTEKKENKEIVVIDKKEPEIKESKEIKNIKNKEIVEEKPEIKEKKPKIDIWKKRTVGDVFDSALERYYQRKALRESG